MRTLVIALVLHASTLRAEPVVGSVTGKVIVNDKGKKIPAKYVYVYLEPVGSKQKVEPGEPKVIKQEERQFSPHVVMIPLGGTVLFTNADKEEHNVFGPEPYFDMGRYNRNLKGKPHDFKLEAEHRIYCDIHPWMWARVKVVKSNWFVEVAEDGTFTIPNVPVGKYKAFAWRPSVESEPKKQITVAEGKAVDIELHLNKGKPPEHLVRKDGTKYPPLPYDRPTDADAEE